MQWDSVNEIERHPPVEDEESKGLWGPGKRYGHTLNLVCREEERAVYAIGGTNAERKQTIGVCKYDIIREGWKRPKPVGPQPPPRENHACTSVGSKLFLFGGRNSEQTLGDLSILDTEANEWLDPATTGDSPCPREGHSAVLVKQSVYVFGGYRRVDSEDEDDHFFDDAYRLDTVTLSWHKLETTGERPEARTGHSMVAWNSSLVLFGGQDSGGHSLADLYFLDTETLVWRKLQPRGELPAPRAGHVSALGSNQLVVFGGVDKVERRLFNDIYILDLEELVWRRQAARGSFPRHRFSAAAAMVDDRGGDLLIYGGCNENLAPSSGFFVLLTGLSQIHPGIQRLPKHTSLEPFYFAPPPRANSQPPFKKRKTIIPTLSGHSAKVDQATATLYFRTLSKIAGKLGTDNLAPQRFPEGSPFAREISTGGEAYGGKEGVEGVGRGGTEEGGCRDGGSGGGEEEENGSIQFTGRSLYQNGAREEPVENSRGGRGGSNTPQGEGGHPNRSGLADLLEAQDGSPLGGVENGCSASPQAQRDSQPNEQGKLMVSAGVQTLYSSMGLQYPLVNFARAKKLVPVRKGMRKTACDCNLGDQMPQQAVNGSPENGCVEESGVGSEPDALRSREVGGALSGDEKAVGGNASQAGAIHTGRLPAQSSRGESTTDSRVGLRIENSSRIHTVGNLLVEEHPTEEGRSIRDISTDVVSTPLHVTNSPEPVKASENVNESERTSPVLASSVPPFSVDETLLSPFPALEAQQQNSPEVGVNTPPPTEEHRRSGPDGTHSHQSPDPSVNSQFEPAACLESVNRSVPSESADVERSGCACLHQGTIPVANPMPPPICQPKALPNGNRSPSSREQGTDVSNLYSDRPAPSSTYESDPTFVGRWENGRVDPPPRRRNPDKGIAADAVNTVLLDANDSGSAEAEKFGGWAPIKFPAIKEEAPRESIDIKIEDLLQTGFSISAAVGGQQLRGFLFSNNPKFLAIAQSLALEKLAEEEKAEQAAAEEQRAARLREKADKEARKLEAAHNAQEVLRIAAAARAERAAHLRTTPPLPPEPDPLDISPGLAANHVNPLTNPPADTRVYPDPVSNPVVSTVNDPPKEVTASVKKGRKREPGAKRGVRGKSARLRPQTGQETETETNYRPPVIHVPVAMQTPMPPHIPIVMRPPLVPGVHVADGHVSSEGSPREVLFSPVVEHAPDGDLLRGGIEPLGEMGHVAIDEQMPDSANAEHSGHENLLYEEPVLDHYAPIMHVDPEHIEAPYVVEEPDELDTGQQLLEEEQPDPTGNYSSFPFTSGVPPYAEGQVAYAHTGEAYSHPEGYDGGQVVTGEVYHSEPQPGYAQGHVVYEHTPTAYYAHDPYYGTYQVASEGYQGHVPYHPQYMAPEYQHGYHDPYGHYAPVMHPYGMQAPPIHYGAPIYGPVQPATASAIDPTHVAYQQQMYNMQVYGTPYDPSQWPAPPAQ